MGVYERLQTSVPVNRLAASQTFRGDGGFENCDESRETRWDAPPICEKKPWNAPNIEGERYGKLTIVKFYKSAENAKKKSQWLVRCVCGTYETRKYFRLRAAGDAAMCGRCGYFEKVRWNSANPQSPLQPK